MPSLPWRPAQSPGGGTAQPPKPVAVLAITAVVLLLGGVGCLVVAKVAHIAMKRLGLDLWDVLLWLGLAEARTDDLAARRSVRLAVVVEGPRPAS
jgi:hypothetical protein